MFYVREALPTDKWWLAETKLTRLLMQWSNSDPCYDLKEPATIEDRRQAALAAKAKLLEDTPVYVDNMDNEVNLTYEAWLTQVYFLYEQVIVRDHSGLGPYGLSPEELDAELSLYLNAD
jgi:hypothetical protein